MFKNPQNVVCPPPTNLKNIIIFCKNSFFFNSSAVKEGEAIIVKEEKLFRTKSFYCHKGKGGGKSLNGTAIKKIFFGCSKSYANLISTGPLN